MKGVFLCPAPAKSPAATFGRKRLENPAAGSYI